MTDEERRAVGMVLTAIEVAGSGIITTIEKLALLIEGAREALEIPRPGPKGERNSG